MKNSSIYFSSKTAFLKIIFFTFFILIISGTSKMFAQPEIEWERTYGGSESDQGISIQATPDGGFITASYSFSEDGDLNANNGSTDIWIAKTTATGDIEWQKNYGGSEGDSPHSIKLTPDGGYIMIGGTYSTDGDVSGNSNGKEDVWVIKLNAEGDLEWEQNYGGSESDWGVDIENVSIGGYMFIAQTLSSDGDLSNTTYRGERDTWVVYISETGQIISHQAHGGSETELPSKILALEDNSFMVVGSSSSIDGEVSSNLGFSDFWLMKVNLQADLIWEKSYGGSRTEFLEDGIVTQDGGFLLVGESFSSDGDVSNNVEGFDYWMIKLDENGEKEWTHSSGDTLQDYFTGVLQRPDGKYLVMKDGHGFSLYDEQGNEEWTYVFYNPTYQNFNFIDIVARPDGGFTTIGSAFSLISGAANKGETLIVNFKIPTLTTTPCAGDLAGFTTLGEFGGSKYYISNETARPSDAQDAALANGGHLATISSQEENDFIQPFLSEFTYIGLNDFDEE